MNLILPVGFQPFADLVVCGNRFIDGIAPFAKGNQPLLLIGKGDLPVIWLYVQSEVTQGQALALIQAGQPMHELVTVEQDDERKRIIVKSSGSTILSVRKILDDFATIELIDLRPYGLLLYGSEGGLNLGGKSMAGNRSEGVSVFADIG